jgi:hypothetical protein
MSPGAAPLWEQLIILIFGPPIMAAFWWIAARGWALTVQGGTASPKTRGRQKVEFYVVLIVMYVVGLGMALYARLR